MAIYRAVDGINRQVKEVFSSVSGINRKIKNQYSVSGGINRIVYKHMNGTLANTSTGYKTYSLNDTKLLSNIGTKTISTISESPTPVPICNGFKIESIEMQTVSKLNIRFDQTTNNGLKVWSELYITNSDNTILKQKIVTLPSSNVTTQIDVSDLSGIYNIVCILVKDVDATNQYSGSLTIHDVSLDAYLIIE